MPFSRMYSGKGWGMTATFTRNISRHSLLRQIMSEEQIKAEIGERIRELRENSPETNRSIADHVGVGERSVAAWIAGGGITYAHAKKVAELFGVSVDYIWRGRELETPDLLGALNGADESLLETLGAMRSQYAEVLGELSALRTELRRVLSRLSRGDNDLEGPGS